MDKRECIYLVKEYNYTFKVLPVDRCPMNESDWQAAAEIFGCNDTHVYHCVPDKFHSSLIEFCYYKKPNLVQKGTKCFFSVVLFLQILIFFIDLIESGLQKS